MLTSLDRRAKLFLTLTALFVSALLIGDIIGSKLFDVHLFGSTWVLSAGIVPFPITFLLTDLLNEFYGKRAASVVTWVGFGMAVFTFTIVAIAVALPWHAGTRDPNWKGVNEATFDIVFNNGQQILIASMVAYLFSQFLDIWIFNLVKTKTSNRFIWARATGSTLFSQLVDTVVIQTGAWFDKKTPSEIVGLIVTAYIVKIIVAIGLTPLIYLGHSLVQRVLKIEPVKLDADGEMIAPQK